MVCALILSFLPTVNKLGYEGLVLSMAGERVIFFLVFFVFGSLGWPREGVFRVWECVCVAP